MDLYEDPVCGLKFSLQHHRSKPPPVQINPAHLSGNHKRSDRQVAETIFVQQTMRMIVGIMEKHPTHHHVAIVNSFRFLGTTIPQDGKWDNHIGPHHRPGTRCDASVFCKFQPDAVNIFMSWATLFNWQMHLHPFVGPWA